MVNNYPHTSTESAKGKEEKEKESIGPMMKSNNLLDYFFFFSNLFEGLSQYVSLSSSEHLKGRRHTHHILRLPAHKA